MSFNEVLRLNPRAAAAQVFLSRLHLASGASDTAVQFAEGALKNSPGNPEARSSLIRGLIGRRDIKRAETELASLRQQYPKVGIVYALDGALKMQKGDLPGARAAYEQALKITPDLFEALAGLTIVDVRQNRTPEARARLDARLAAAPNRADLLILSAQVYGAQQDLPQAEASLRRAIQVDSANAQAYALLAGTLLVQGKLDAALSEFDQLAKRNPGDIGPPTMAAMILDKQAKSAEAQKRYEAIVASQSRAPVAANNLAWIYAESGTKLDDALRLAQAAAAEMPDNPEIQDTIGWVYYKKELPSTGDSRRSRRAWRRRRRTPFTTTISRSRSPRAATTARRASRPSRR